MKKVLCPVCKGTGRIGWYNEITCHGCEGTGEIEIEDVKPSEDVPWWDRAGESVMDSSVQRR